MSTQTSFWDDPDIKKAAEGGGYHKLVNPGDTVAGTIKALKKQSFDNGDRTAIEIEYEDESKFTAGQVLLLRDLYVLQPVKGEHLTITLADIQKRQAKTLKLFRIELVRLNGETESIDQTES